MLACDACRIVMNRLSRDVKYLTETRKIWPDEVLDQRLSISCEDPSHPSGSGVEACSLFMEESANLIRKEVKLRWDEASEEFEEDIVAAEFCSEKARICDEDAKGISHMIDEASRKEKLLKEDAKLAVGWSFENMQLLDVSTTCACRDLPPIHPLAAPLLEQKRDTTGRQYRTFVSQAEAGAVPDAVIHQIHLDVAGQTGKAVVNRERQSLREDLVDKSLRQSLSLGADGWAVDSMPSLGDPVPTYVQGCSMMAAMCLGFTAGREEEGFWLFIHLLEDVLGADFFSRQPALVGYHGDRAAVAALVALQSPSLAELMGVQSLGESISALASRCLLSGFVGFLSGPPLVAFWEELLQVRCADFPRLPLISWLAGLVHHAEGQLTSALVGLSSDEAVPVFFRTVQQAAKSLPNNWRPRVRVSQAQVLELRQISKAAAEKYRMAQEALSLKEMHAKNVSASLDRTCSALLDAMKLAEGVGSTSATAAAATVAAESSRGKPTETTPALFCVSS
ncbi:GRTP1 [Symbiodinium natans]|uniref:GRTP1 protein n=1 Tax=Symbiodinium natans TaxID=878477 RepID=A0A812RUL8_9DINO|nr:GRTP1 [Symbiodinium natans]